MFAVLLVMFETVIKRLAKLPCFWRLAGVSEFRAFLLPIGFDETEDCESYLAPIED
jgi:hypothetical protein